MGPAFHGIDSMGSRRFAHTLMFALNLACFSSLLTFVAVKTPAKRGGLRCLEQWGPFLGMLLGAVLIMLDHTRHILLDSSMFVEQLHMFNPDMSLTPAGAIGKYTTWIGNLLLFASLVWYVLPARRCGVDGFNPV
mmetsp:Transcript_70489/g.204436  ORF Transcript_70489/g.204436 Transcript_70489/m.204436 type:complete len:135 (+) Transcript_70489:387-791(+)